MNSPRETGHVFRLSVGNDDVAVDDDEEDDDNDHTAAALGSTSCPASLSLVHTCSCSPESLQFIYKRRRDGHFIR